MQDEQNVREVLEGAKWRQADDLSGVKWPLAGYAPGNYIGTCRSCNKQMHGCAKRALQCLSCAITELREGYEEIDRAFRIKVWNEAKKSGLSDDAAMAEISRQLHALATAALKAKEQP